MLRVNVETFLGGLSSNWLRSCTKPGLDKQPRLFKPKTLSISRYLSTKSKSPREECFCIIYVLVWFHSPLRDLILSIVLMYELNLESTLSESLIDNVSAILILLFLLNPPNS